MSLGADPTVAKTALLMLLLAPLPSSGQLLPRPAAVGGRVLFPGQSPSKSNLIASADSTLESNLIPSTSSKLVFVEDSDTVRNKPLFAPSPITTSPPVRRLVFSPSRASENPRPAAPPATSPDKLSRLQEYLRRVQLRQQAERAAALRQLGTGLGTNNVDVSGGGGARGTVRTGRERGPAALTAALRDTQARQELRRLLSTARQQPLALEPTAPAITARPPPLFPQAPISAPASSELLLVESVLPASAAVRDTGREATTTTATNPRDNGRPRDLRPVSDAVHGLGSVLSPDSTAVRLARAGFRSVPPPAPSRDSSPRPAGGAATDLDSAASNSQPFTALQNIEIRTGKISDGFVDLAEPGSQEFASSNVAHEEFVNLHQIIDTRLEDPTVQDLSDTDPVGSERREGQGTAGGRSLDLPTPAGAGGRALDLTRMDTGTVYVVTADDGSVYLVTEEVQTSDPDLPAADPVLVIPDPGVITAAETNPELTETTDNAAIERRKSDPDPEAEIQGPGQAVELHSPDPAVEVHSPDPAVEVQSPDGAIQLKDDRGILFFPGNVIHSFGIGPSPAGQTVVVTQPRPDVPSRIISRANQTATSTTIIAIFGQSLAAVQPPTDAATQPPTTPTPDTANNRVDTDGSGSSSVSTASSIATAATVGSSSLSSIATAAGSRPVLFPERAGSPVAAGSAPPPPLATDRSPAAATGAVLNFATSPGRPQQQPQPPPQQQQTLVFSPSRDTQLPSGSSRPRPAVSSRPSVAVTQDLQPATSVGSVTSAAGPGLCRPEPDCADNSRRRRGCSTAQNCPARQPCCYSDCLGISVCQEV